MVGRHVAERVARHRSLRRAVHENIRNLMARIRRHRECLRCAFIHGHRAGWIDRTARSRARRDRIRVRPASAGQRRDLSGRQRAAVDPHVIDLLAESLVTTLVVANAVHVRRRCTVTRSNVFTVNVQCRCRPRTHRRHMVPAVGQSPKVVPATTKTTPCRIVVHPEIQTAVRDDLVVSRLGPCERMPCSRCRKRRREPAGNRPLFRQIHHRTQQQLVVPVVKRQRPADRSARPARAAAYRPRMVVAGVIRGGRAARLVQHPVRHEGGVHLGNGDGHRRRVSASVAVTYRVREAVRPQKAGVGRVGHVRPVVHDGSVRALRDGIHAQRIPFRVAVVDEHVYRPRDIHRHCHAVVNSRRRIILPGDRYRHHRRMCPARGIRHDIGETIRPVVSGRRRVGHVRAVVHRRTVVGRRHLFHAQRIPVRVGVVCQHVDRHRGVFGRGRRIVRRHRRLVPSRVHPARRHDHLIGRRADGRRVQVAYHAPVLPYPYSHRIVVGDCL